ncbi:hypothetical protein CR513_25488, partial [Mucuna pruriens]
MKEQINKIFELLTQGATLNAAATVTRPIHQGEQPTTKRHEQAAVNNSGVGPTQGPSMGPPLIYRAGPCVQPTGALPQGDSSGQSSLALGP